MCSYILKHRVFFEQICKYVYATAPLRFKSFSRPTQYFRIATLYLAVIAILTACSPAPPIPTIDPQRADEENLRVGATGVVVPPQFATLSFLSAGEVISLNVAAGDVVEEGDILAHLDTSMLDYEIAEAKAALEIARANLRKASKTAHPSEIEQAEHQLSAAAASVSQAVADRDRIKAGASEVEIFNAQIRLQQAQVGFNQAQVNYNEANASDVNDDEIENLAEDLRYAQHQVVAAQEYLTDLLDGADASDLQLADAQVWAASAEHAAAEAYLVLIEAGPRPENVAVAEAQLLQAQASLEAAEASREKAVIRAPFDGVVSMVYIRAHEWASPGQQIFLIAASGDLQVETTDVNEIDVARITVGSKVAITFDALPNTRVTGTVISIATRASDGAGVNYAVRIILDEVPSGLRWGMTAYVDITV